MADSHPSAMLIDDNATDDDLMHTYVRGQAMAFDTLYARHHRPLYRFVPRCSAARRRSRSARCSRTAGCVSFRRASAERLEERHAAPGCSRWHTIEPSIACAATDARSLSTPTPKRRARRRGPVSPRPQPRRAPSTAHSGATPAAACSIAWTHCRRRNAASSCSITKKASASTNGRAHSTLASKPRRAGCATP